MPWVARIARREALRRVARRTELAAAEPPDAPDQSAADDLELAVLRLDVGSALAALRPEDRKLLELRYRRDLTHVRAAAELGLPVGTVKVRLHRLRKLLEAHLH